MNASKYAHLLSLQAKFNFSRRAFVGSPATGCASAVLPISAESITTDTQGLVIGHLSIPVSDGSIPKNRTMPASGGRFASCW